jgi:flagellar motor switch protein FliN/FliY
MAEDAAKGASAVASPDTLAEYANYLDIPMHVTLEIGRKNMKVRDILTLKPQSVVEVMKAAGENLDVLINGKLVAFGEILEMDNKAGIRLTDFYVQP